MLNDEIFLLRVSDILRPFGHSNLSNKVLTQLLLYGDKKFSSDLNRTILNLTIQFILKTGRFEFSRFLSNESARKVKTLSTLH